MARRILTYFTLIACLLVGTVVHRQFTTFDVSLRVSSPFTRYLSRTEFFEEKLSHVEEKITFSTIRFEEEKPVLISRQKTVATKVVKAPAEVVKTEEVKISIHALPFEETIQVDPVFLKTEMSANLVALYREFKFTEEKMLAAKTELKDSVSTLAAAPAVSSGDEEPVFFEYENEEKTTPVSKSKVTEVLLPTKQMKTEVPVAPSEEIEFFDLVSESKEEPIETQEIIRGSTILPKKAEPVTTWTVDEKKKQKRAQSSDALATTVPAALVDQKPESSAGFLGSSGLTIQAIGTDLKGAKKLNGFEVRFMDDYSEILDDYGSGQISFDYALSEDQMTRSARILKRGFTPTNTDLILETSGAQTTLPLIDEDTFNEMLRPYESAGPMGALLLELDDETQLAQVDVPFIKVVHFNDRLEESSEEAARYQLFVGVRAGNALITYHHRKGHTANRIVSIQNHELTFDNNLYRESEDKKISLWEENLLSKEKKPLVMATSSFKRFMTGKTGAKISQNSYRFKFKEDNFATRRYFELGHLSEPVFVGTKSNTKLEIPSESFMRYVLSRLDNSGLQNRCIVQVNLKKAIRSADVGSESVEDTLLTHVQTLDADGQFYDTPSDQTQKLIIMGESHAPSEISPDGKINMKLRYVDGTAEYLSSYCSPNTYVVEQL